MARKKRKPGDFTRQIADWLYKPKEKRARQLREKARQEDRRLDMKRRAQHRHLESKRFS